MGPSDDRVAGRGMGMAILTGDRATNAGDG